MTTHAAWLFLPLTAWMTSLTPQETTQAKPEDSRKALAAKVRKTHRGGFEGPIDRFRATITIRPRGKGADNIDLDLQVIYGKKIERKKGVFAEMIRYSMNEGDKPLARGKDPRPWMQIGKEIGSLSTRDNAKDADLLRSHTRLCRQMLQFLDPGAILEGLEGKDPVKAEKLTLGRLKLDTDMIHGRLASFPVFQENKEVKTEAVELEAFVSKNGQLAAVKVFPLDKKGKVDRTRGELVLLQKYAKSNGVLVPRELVIYGLKNGKPSPHAKVSLSVFEVNAKLTKADFARPK